MFFVIPNISAKKILCIVLKCDPLEQTTQSIDSVPAADCCILTACLICQIAH